MQLQRLQCDEVCLGVHQFSHRAVFESSGVRGVHTSLVTPAASIVAAWFFSCAWQKPHGLHAQLAQCTSVCWALHHWKQVFAGLGVPSHCAHLAGADWAIVGEVTSGTGADDAEAGFGVAACVVIATARGDGGGGGVATPPTTHAVPLVVEHGTLA